MTLFSKQIAFIDTLEDLIFKELKSVINEFGFVLEENIAEDQLFKKGQDGNQEPLKDQKTGRLGYTRTTIRLKISKGQPVDRITLRDEKKFHPSITIEGFEDRFEISSDVTHAKFLIKRYGENILKPSRENMTNFMTNYFIPNIKNRIDDEIAR